MYKQLLLSYSYSPAIDIGQVEGAFVMGLGLYLYEEIKYDPDTGRNVTNNAWVSCVLYIGRASDHRSMSYIQSTSRTTLYLGPEIYLWNLMSR